MLDFLDLREGSNKVTIVTTPFQYYSHYIDIIDSKINNFRQKEMCKSPSIFDYYCYNLNIECKNCYSGDKPKPRWIIGIIHNDQKYYLDIGDDINYQLLNMYKNYNGINNVNAINIISSYRNDKRNYHVLPIFGETKRTDDFDMNEMKQMCNLK